MKAKGKLLLNQITTFTIKYSRVKMTFFKHISNCLGCDRVGDGAIDEVNGLNSIIKLSSDDLMDNCLFVIKRKLRKTALIAVFIIVLHFLLYSFNGGPL